MIEFSSGGGWGWTSGKSSVRTWAKKSSRDPISKKESAINKAGQGRLRPRLINIKLLRLERIACSGQVTEEDSGDWGMCWV